MASSPSSSRAERGAALLLLLCVASLVLAVAGAAGAADVGAGSEDHSGRSLQIFSGSRVSTSSYPFGAMLVSHNRQHVCTGSLISPGVVLTAAHCFSDHGQVYDLDNDFTQRRRFEEEFVNSYKVVLGNDFASRLQSSVVRTIGVRKVVIGEPFDFDRGSPEWDLALVFLDTCQDEFQPIKLLRYDDDDEHEGEESYEDSPASLGSVLESLLDDGQESRVRVVGWGDTEGFCVKHYYPGMEHEMDVPDSLHEMQYSVVACDPKVFCSFDPSECANASTMLCMQEKDAASCDGDSGAPVFLSATDLGIDSDGSEEAAMPAYVQVAILSGGQIAKDDIYREQVPLPSYFSEPEWGFDVGGEYHGAILSSSEKQKNAPIRFTDNARGSLIPGYADWIEGHIMEEDDCLLDANRTAGEIFVSVRQLREQKKKK